MKDRSELLSIFMSFFNEIKNQFGRIIKIFRSDNAKEYFSSELSSFLSSQGVLHQSKCPHTSQQNGIAKRKNRHLVETARTLMLNANVPVHHWVDAILSSCFLINRMPSSSLENKIPYSITYPKEPLFHVSPQVFGCTCFVHNVSPGLDKLSARAIKCVFLGYSRLQKGYRHYSPETRKFYMSADVTFFEQTPFFSCTTHDSLSIQQVLPVCSHVSIPPQISLHNQEVPQSPIPTATPIQATPPPLVTYQRRTRQIDPILPEESPNSCPSPSDVPTTDLSEDNSGWPIALRKGIRSTRELSSIISLVFLLRLFYISSYYS
uniref:Retrovirus-related Pol polyprotein from transposon TNT 1-94 n=1 Tax=Cajanus cajan TaxID=3821 RepID=A0A151UGL4_CAJCA